MLSFPSWERGLKFVLDWEGNAVHKVVPLVGTWIEIVRMINQHLQVESFPSWERGLKLDARDRIRTIASSFPSWERGLKFLCRLSRISYYRRSPRGNVD